ncbi:hypothetical protein QBK99_17140 [Corticibacterium sp. UT-5YL-CI-8]|nr:hypothetical protein [Tianweitania sp. UT-5YL-CI-8]
MKPGTPKALKTVVMRACLAAFSDPSHARNSEKACDRQAAKVRENEKFAVAFTCMTAMAIAYD